MRYLSFPDLRTIGVLSISLSAKHQGSAKSCYAAWHGGLKADPTNSGCLAGMSTFQKGMNSPRELLSNWFWDKVLDVLIWNNWLDETWMCLRENVRLRPLLHYISEFVVLWSITIRTFRQSIPGEALVVANCESMYSGSWGKNCRRINTVKCPPWSLDHRWHTSKGILIKK